MNFLSGFFITIAAFFGFAEPQPAEVAEQVMSESDLGSKESSLESDTTVLNIDSQNERVASSDTETQLEPENMSAEAKELPLPVMVETKSVVSVSPDIQTMVVAGGCFWCVEADLEKVPGVSSVVSGYSGGNTKSPTYDSYGSGGHREVVEVTYDANLVSYEGLLIVTLKTTDPTDDDGTFNDRGDKYSSAFYYETPDQKEIIDNLIKEVNEHGPYDKPLAIDVEERSDFWRAEDRHQDYYKGTLTKLKYQFYRDGSGRTDFIKKYWGSDTSPDLPWRNQTTMNTEKTYAWSGYIKPDQATLQETMEATAFKVTQKDGTERAGTSPLDKNWERGIYVDILSGEPLYSSRDKFDSGTGWPSFVAPITDDALTEHEDRKLFSVRTETRSAIADNHIGHVFTDGPADRGGLRYCMNGAALRFVSEADMETQGYSDFLSTL